MDKLDDVWTRRDYPVLREVTKRFDQGAGLVEASDVAATIGLDVEEVQRALSALKRRGLIDSEGTAESVTDQWATQVSGAAYLITGLHPDGDEALSGLISALRQAAEETSDEDARSRLRKAADALASVGRDLGVGIMTAVISKYAGG